MLKGYYYTLHGQMKATVQCSVYIVQTVESTCKYVNTTVMAHCCYINDNTWVLHSPHLFAGTPMLNALTFSVNDTHVVIMWTFNDSLSFNFTIDCGDQPIVDNIPAPMTGNMVIITQDLTSYPAATNCTVTVGTSNLLGSSTTLTNTFMTPVGKRCN